MKLLILALAFVSLGASLDYQECPNSPIACKPSACFRPNCPRQTGATCKATCYGCIANYFDKFGNDVTKKCSCRDGSKGVQCLVDPCEKATCGSRKDVECRTDRCGSCRAFFYDKNGKVVNCAVDVCKLPKETGPCEAINPRYYFNERSGKCEKFNYGGCQGNANNFRSLADCERRCLPKNACSQPMYIGPCRAAIPRYYFNQAKGTCEKFYYGGCHGNDNNFQTLLDCMKKCSSEPICPPTSRQATSLLCSTPCKSDHSCTGQQKCCLSGACGHICRDPYYPECPDGRNIQCLIPECNNARCPRQKGAKCIGFCNGCVARFFDRFGNEVTDKCQCKKGMFESKCKVDPCKTATCPGHRSEDVECRSNYCGGCKAIFYDRRGNEVQCRNPRCPKPPPGIITTCDVRCFGDSSCRNGQICCPYGCSIRCVDPEYPIFYYS